MKLLNSVRFCRLELLTVLLLSCLLLDHPASAEPVRIVSWNVREAFEVGDVTNRTANYRNMAQALSPDILLVQEVTSLDVVNALRDACGLSDYYTTCSNFTQNDHNKFNSFEVGIISKFPFDEVIEYDPTPDNEEFQNDPDEIELEPVKKIGIRDVGVERGFLWASVSEINLTLFVVHMKSSQGRSGKSDSANAEKRELVAAAVALGVKEDMDLFPDYSYLVAGDFNVGHSDAAKNGKSLRRDCYSHCGQKDRYDETHVLLGSGLVGGLRMTNLMAHVTTSTYPAFPGSPIDNIYVAGAHAGDFQSAQAASETFGSDHLPVFTDFDAPVVISGLRGGNPPHASSATQQASSGKP